MIDANRVRELLDYDPYTGQLTWRVSRGRVRKGDVAGGLGNKGYIIVFVDGKGYHAHRIAWLHVHGFLPAKHLDHIDGSRANNRLENLREATNAENQQNLQRPRSHNKSGLLGVSIHQGHWRAQIGLNGKAKHLGHFSTKEAAFAAYLEAKRHLHPMGRL